MAEGQTVIIGCRYEGAPRVTVVWKALLSDPKQPEIDRRNIDDPRFRTLPTGDLEIKVGCHLFIELCGESFCGFRAVYINKY